MPMNEKDNTTKDAMIAELHAEIASLKAILYQMPGNIYWKSKKGLYLGTNYNNLRNVGFAKVEDVVGKYSYELMPLELSKKIDAADLEIMDSQKEVSFEEEGIDSTGKTVIYLSSKKPLFNEEGVVTGILGISVDITRQKKAEEKLKLARKKADAANKAKSQFLAMISHELRTPLTSVLGFSTFLQQEELTVDERNTYTGHVVSSANYLLSLVNKLLDFSKLEADKAEPVVCVVVDFKKLVLNVMAMLDSFAKEKKLLLSFDYDKNAPEKMMGDARILQQILVNLVNNAIKFTPQGSVKIKVHCVGKANGFVKLEIGVQDTGVGIPGDKLKAIFKEFYQVDDIYTRSESMAGTGLGLAIVRKLVKLIGGKIQVTSRINQGSYFSFIASFPLEDSGLAYADETNLIASSNKNIVNPNKLRVLLVEDDALVQMVHQRMLNNLGCEVDVVENGKRALTVFEDNYNMLFVDIGLPDINGFELIKTMKEKYQGTRYLPIIALTGFSSDAERDRCLLMGADAVLVKPVTQVSLHQIIMQYAVKNISLMHSKLS